MVSCLTGRERAQQHFYRLIMQSDRTVGAEILEVILSDTGLDFEVSSAGIDMHAMK